MNFGPTKRQIILFSWEPSAILLDQTGCGEKITVRYKTIRTAKLPIAPILLHMVLINRCGSRQAPNLYGNKTD